MDGVTDPLKEVPALRGVAGPKEARRARNWRRVGLGIFAVIVLVAATNLLGPRDATATGSTSGGADVTVEYPKLTRSGAASAVAVTVEQADGRVVIELPTLVFERLGIETITPAPATETSSKTSVRLTFDPPPSGDLAVQLSGRMPTRSTVGAFTYPVRVAVADQEPTDVVSVKTWVLP